MRAPLFYTVQCSPLLGTMQPPTRNNAEGRESCVFKELGGVGMSGPDRYWSLSGPRSGSGPARGRIGACRAGRVNRNETLQEKTKLQ